ncbi:hypothetical protein Lser_V15G37336 [Lactuca serriola]
MASSSSSPSALAFSTPLWKYHVFLSFRGEDTRKTFVDHLYTALVQQGIYTYKDDETLPQGESISPTLMKAIEESQIAIIVFSKNYADSSWCLDELAYIMKCKDTKGLTVMPIFYDMEPSAVRKQKQNYEKAFFKHELENNDKVGSWRKALVDASNLSGWETKQIANGHEAQGIKEIVDTISHRLHLATSNANENLIGIEARVQEFKSKLQIDSRGVRMIGIWGVGGGGKTTLASYVYSEISSNFDGSCFVENIRDESSKYGLQKLQEKILLKVLKQKEMEVHRVEEGRCMIRDRLCHRKVLIVLDDVDHFDQLKALAGSHDWFGDGSRIIITTRDEHLLNAHKVDVIHNISLLNDDEAIKLFSKHALRDYRPMKDFALLSSDVVSYAGGLPLALTILGSFLCDKDIIEWRSALARLKEIPESDIVEKLKISYDGLKPVEKELFLDIACFFRREYKNERIMATFHAFGFYPVIGIKVLIEKALITISEGRFDLHDLVQEMAHYIVRGKHPKNPEKHSRVWKKEDLLKICVMDATKELDMVEAIQCNSYDLVEPVPKIIANMKNLRWIYWRGDLASPFPSNFLPSELCCLTLDGISPKQLWKGYKHLPNLKIMELADLKNLIKTPDFDGLPNLERFTLHVCHCLKEIHPSIGRLERLVFLSIKYCANLKIFPPLTRLKKLESLSVSHCPKLVKLVEIPQNMDKLPYLHLDNGGKEVASYKKLSTNILVTWWMCGVVEVKKPHKDLNDVECSLQEPCVPLNNMNNHIRKLNLSYCSVGDKDIDYAIWDLPNLEELNLEGNKFSRLSFSRMRLPQLKWLNVSYCKELTELSELPSSIAVVKADYCRSLETFGDISKCRWLWKVSLWGENKLVGDILLDSMLEGNALEDHFISVALERQMIPKGFVGRLFRWKTFVLHLPHDWSNHFCGFLICFLTKINAPYLYIKIEWEVDEDSRSEICEESNEASGLEYRETKTYVGYVSFSSLRHTTWWNSSCNKISFSIDMGCSSASAQSNFGVELVPRKIKGDEVQKTDCSEFWDKELEDETTFMIQHDSPSSIKISWQPYLYPRLQQLTLELNVHNIKEMQTFTTVATLIGNSTFL